MSDAPLFMNSGTSSQAVTPMADMSCPAATRVAFVRSELYNELAGTLQHLGKCSNATLLPRHSIVRTCSLPNLISAQAAAP